MRNGYKICAQVMYLRGRSPGHSNVTKSPKCGSKPIATVDLLDVKDANAHDGLASSSQHYVIEDISVTDGLRWQQGLVDRMKHIVFDGGAVCVRRSHT